MAVDSLFNSIYKNRTVLVTGHTGFKGSWLVYWLNQMGANIIGYSLDSPTKLNHFELLDLDIVSINADVRDSQKLNQIFKKYKPDIVFHLAAQALVRESYSNPVLTYETNVMGTLKVLEACRNAKVKAIVNITSDKVYENREIFQGYKETDKLGGYDPYSSSKACADILAKSYRNSYFNLKLYKNTHQTLLATCRAGNVIGGGDWAKDRIVVDCMEAWSKNQTVEIRSPEATRPWQHVLEPLSGYLNLGEALYLDNKLHGEAFNFGPRAEQNHTVQQLLNDLSKYWHFGSVDKAYRVTDNIPFHEAGLLKLNCDKALFYLKWHSNLEYRDTIRFTSEWYYDFYKNGNDIYSKTVEQIDEYEKLALEKQLVWTE